MKGSLSDKRFTEIRNQFWNAFKHISTRKGADRDDADLLASFSEEENEERLFVGWTDYATAVRSLPVEAQVYNTWFLALHPVKFQTAEGREFMAQLQEAFPDLANLPKNRQRQRLRHSIEKWKRQRDLMSDSATDSRPLILA